MCTSRMRKRNHPTELCEAGFTLVRKLIISGKRNVDIRQLMRDAAHISNLDDKWLYAVRKTPEIQDMFSRATMEAVQSQYSPRARRIDVLNAAIDDILKGIGIKLVSSDGKFNAEEIKQSIDEEQIERERIEGPAPGSISGSIIDQLEDTDNTIDDMPKSERLKLKRDHERQEREKKKSNLWAWAEVRNLLNQLRVEMNEYEGNISLGLNTDPTELRSMAMEISKQQVLALLESMEEQVAEFEGVVVPVVRAIQA